MTNKFLLPAWDVTVDVEDNKWSNMPSDWRYGLSLSIRLSHFLADLFVAKGWIKEDRKIAYVVGLDVIFSTLIDWLAVGTLAVLRGRFLEAVIYLLFFLTVRRYSGGYHAHTRAGCFTVFTGLYLLGDIAVAESYKNCSGLFLTVYGLCCMAVGELIFYFCVPIPNDRKKYTQEWLDGARKKAFLSLNVWYCLAVCLGAFNLALSQQIIMASNIVVLLILMSKRRERR